MVDSEDHEESFLDRAGLAFLRRRLHNRRMRAAAVRGLKVVSPARGGGLHFDFHSDAAVFAHAQPWMAAHAAEIAALPPPPDPEAVPSLSIVFLIVGSRGDVQPFLPIARRLAEHHRVRLATHAEFRPFVEGAGLEFFPLAGDPHELMEYMVKTGGRIVPIRLDHLVEDVPKKRAVMADILASTWAACTQPDPETAHAEPFRAQLIIANPPSYGHVHCAEALHIPVHMIFTMPWTATSAFPHPLARIPPDADRPVQNFLSYGIADLLTWSGIGDLINDFRETMLGLEQVSITDGAALLDDHEVPFTYLWPAHLVPKPADWGPHIDLANFTFYDQARQFEPPPDLQTFLAAGEPPIYVGFGSIVVEDPAALTHTVFAALARSGARAVVSQGWAHLGGDTVPPNVHLIGDTPHDWLFARCRAVCHHGGAGTTAAGLRAGLPTIVIPFFGDQFFWGQVIEDAGAGPSPIPFDELSEDALAAAFVACADPAVRARAAELGAAIRASDGVELAVQSIYRHLPAPRLRCGRDAEHTATLYCVQCAEPVCAGCHDRHHPGHESTTYQYVDWGERASPGPIHELGDLIADAAHALRVGLEELMPVGRRSNG